MDIPPFLSLPNELILDIAETLTQHDLVHLLKVNRRLYTLLISTLHGFANDAHKSNGKTLCALHWAANKGYEPLIRCLVSKGINIDCRECSGSNGETVLHFAAWQGSEPIVRLLLESGADVNAQDYGRGRTPLHLATGRAHEGVVRVLLQWGADVNLRDRLGRTSLVSWAVEDSRFWKIPPARNGRVFLLLLEYGARVDSSENGLEGWLALREAVCKGQKSIKELLIERSKGEGEGMPEEWKVRARKSIEVARLLQDKGLISVPELQSLMQDKGLITAPELQGTVAEKPVEDQHKEELEIDERPPHEKLRGKFSDYGPGWRVKIRVLCRITPPSRKFDFTLKRRSNQLAGVGGLEEPLEETQQ